MCGEVFGPGAWAPLARALEVYAGGDRGAEVIVHSDEGVVEPFPVGLLFRSPDDLDGIDREAVNLARGRVLDAGAGVGSISLALQEAGLDVTASEVIPEAVEIMERRGVRDVRWGPFQELGAEGAFDTVLLLMNGAALAGTLAAFPRFLTVLQKLLAPGGQVLMDSTDLSSGSPEVRGSPGSGRGKGGSLSPVSETWDYAGNLQYQLEFRGARGAPFPQLFLDPLTLEWVASREGWSCRVVFQGENGRYLARLSRVQGR